MSNTQKAQKSAGEQTTDAAEQGDSIAAAVAVDPMVILQQMSEQLATLNAKVDAKDDEIAALRRDLESTRSVSTAPAGDGSVVDDYGIRISGPEGAIYLGAGRLSTIDEDVAAMKAQAEERFEDFDEERTRQVLLWMSLPPRERRKHALEDLHPYICKTCGHGFTKNEEDEYKIHVSDHLKKARERQIAELSV